MMREPARGSLDVLASSRQHVKEDRRERILSLRFSDAEMYLLREATTPDRPTIADVIRARVFGPLPPLR